MRVDAQRLAFARLLLAKPSLVILDESTSALGHSARTNTLLCLFPQTHTDTPPALAAFFTRPVAELSLPLAPQTCRNYLPRFAHRPSLILCVSVAQSLSLARSFAGLGDEKLMYSLLKDLGATVISVGNRPSLLPFHSKVLRLKGDGAWVMESPEEAAANAE